MNCNQGAILIGLFLMEVGYQTAEPLWICSGNAYCSIFNYTMYTNMMDNNTTDTCGCEMSFYGENCTETLGPFKIKTFPESENLTVYDRLEGDTMWLYDSLKIKSEDLSKTFHSWSFKATDSHDFINVYKWKAIYYKGYKKANLRLADSGIYRIQVQYKGGISDPVSACLQVRVLPQKSSTVTAQTSPDTASNLSPTAPSVTNITTSSNTTTTTTGITTSLNSSRATPIDSARNEEEDVTTSAAFIAAMTTVAVAVTGGVGAAIYSLISHHALPSTNVENLDLFTPGGGVFHSSSSSSSSSTNTSSSGSSSDHTSPAHGSPPAPTSEPTSAPASTSALVPPSTAVSKDPSLKTIFM